MTTKNADTTHNEWSRMMMAAISQPMFPIIEVMIFHGYKFMADKIEPMISSAVELHFKISS